MNYPPTIIVRHKKENPRKCSVVPLKGRPDICFFSYPLKQLPELTSDNQKLRTFIELRKDLSAMWDRSNASREQLVTQLQDWCHRAEESGVQQLHDLSLRMRSYAA